MRFLLRRVRLNQGGYTDRSKYFGTGAPLYEYQDQETGDIFDQVRAYDRQDAIARIKHKYPNATFYGNKEN